MSLSKFNCSVIETPDSDKSRKPISDSKSRLIWEHNDYFINAVSDGIFRFFKRGFGTRYRKKIGARCWVENANELN